MAKPALVLSIPIWLAAFAAQAQTPAADRAALADVQPPAFEAAPPTQGVTVPGVVVNGKPSPRSKCEPNDRTCIIAVAKLVWDQYPRQTAIYCSQEQTQAMVKRSNMESVFAGDAAQVILDSDYMPPALEAVCAYGDQKARDEKAAKKAAEAPTP
jgi:hypothetical protein